MDGDDDRGGGRRPARIVMPGRAARHKALGLAAGAIEHMQRMAGGRDHL
jgi:hypothetical protein